MEFILVILTIIVILLFKINQHYLSEWKRQGIPQSESANFIFGDFKDLLMHKKSIADAIGNIYSKTKHHRIFGTYLSYRTILFINDSKVTRDILLKDSSSFTDRGFHADGTFDPLSEQIFFQRGMKWKTLRSRLTPAFTSQKLKGMLPVLMKNGKILESFINKNIAAGDSVFDLRDLIARLNTNIITSVAFGIDVDTINDSKSIMRQMGVKVFEPNLVAGLRFFTAFFTPIINGIFKFKFVSDEVENFFKAIITENVQLREKTGYIRNDLMQTLIQLKNEGFSESPGTSEVTPFTMNDVCAQSFGFYLGGFETTSTTVSFCLFELAKNPNIQRKVQEEIDASFKTTDDESELYEMVKSLKYLECCMFETLRKYPAVPLLNRRCNIDYRVEGTEFVIKKGTPVVIPLFGMHRDPEIYDCPLEFRPERFWNNPNGSDITDFSFLPFGEGQRVCIGHRMGKQNTKFELALLLSRFSFRSTTMEREIKFNPDQLFLQPSTGHINLEIVPRDSNCK